MNAAIGTAAARDVGSEPVALPIARGDPLLGHVRAIRRDALAALAALADDSGGVAGFRIGLTQALVVSSPSAVREVLIERASDFGRGKRQTRALAPLLGRGLLTSEGELHARQRHLVVPHFSRRRVARYAEKIVAEAERTIGGWADGAEVDLLAEMNSLTMNIVTGLLFSTSIRQNRALARAISDVFDWEMRAMTSAFPLPIWVPTPRNRRASSSIAALRDWINGFVHERRTGGGPSDDILAELMAARYEDGSAIPDELLLDEVLTTWGAAQETSADAQAWTLYLLACHPDALARIRQEEAAVLGGRPVRYDDLAELPYSLQVFKEAMRLYPPAAVIPRQAVRDTVVGGYRVSGGTMVFISAYSMHRRPEVFPDPCRFDPDRFSRERERYLPKGAYLPFGTGGNVCPGSHLAMLEGHLLTTVLAQRIDAELSPGQVVRPELLINLRPAPGVLARIRHR